jgi:peroxiredoxin Q/BCP
LSETSGAQVGTKAPDFTLKDAEGREWRLSDQRGKTTVLLFYPGDETPVCTKQMCSVRDRWTDYTELGAEVVGISTDTVESHKRFTEHYGLPLTLLADEGGRVSGAYGAVSWLPNRSARAVFVIDGKGVLRYRKIQPVSLFRPKDDEIIAAIRAAQGA